MQGSVKRFAAEFEKIPLPVVYEYLRDGCNDAWSSVVEKYTPLVAAVARRRGVASSAIDDVIQNTWLACLQNIGNVKNPEALPGWLVAIARHESVRWYRREQRALEQAKDVPPLQIKSVASAESIVISKLQQGMVGRSFAKLTSRQQELLLALQECSDYKSVAARMGISPGSVGSLRARSLERLRQLIECEMADGCAIDRSSGSCIPGESRAA